MADLTYSNEAENILNIFHNVDLIVYVEGRDDVPFWEFIFDKFSEHSVEINDVGGYPEVLKYMDKIISGEITAIVACDGDYSYAEEFPDHNNILRSYGHSIENSMICEQSIKKVIRSLGRVSHKSINEKLIDDWMYQLFETTRQLVVYDFANHILQSGKSVIGNNCARFMTSQKSSKFCPNKISNFIMELDIELDSDLEKNIIENISNAGRDIPDFIRGHFIFSATLRYVISYLSKIEKSIQISSDAFFGSLMMAFESAFTSKHKHYEYYNNSVCRITAE
ncbi:MAG: DUF4435 domain-containing protein [Saprospiraceae bacterium]